MITTNHNSPNGAPYLRHAREGNDTLHDGWTVTWKIAIPKPRHLMACSTGWIVVILLYCGSILWIDGLQSDWYLSNNSSSWNDFLPGPVTSFLPIRAVHDTDGYGEPLAEPDNLDPFDSSAATSSNSAEVPSSDIARAPAPPIGISKSKVEEREDDRMNVTNIQGDAPSPAVYTKPEENLKDEEVPLFDLEWTKGSATNGTHSESLVTEPANLNSTVDFEAVSRNPVNETFTTSWTLAPYLAPSTTDQYSEGKNETSDFELPKPPEATSEARKSESGEYLTVAAPVNNYSLGDESSTPAKKHEFAVAEAPEPATTTIAPAPTGNVATASPNSDSAPSQDPDLHSSGNPSPADVVPDSETKSEPEPQRELEVTPPTPTFSHWEEEPVIRATKIRGREAVEAFRGYLDCFSESGKWIYYPTPRHLPWNYVGERYLSICDGYHWGVWADDADVIARDGVGEWSVREELKWVWQTNETCPLPLVDRNEFCRRLGPKRNVMVVGDSLNHQLQWSIMNHLITNGSNYQRLLSTDRISDGVYEMCSDIFGEGEGFKISFVRNDRLSLLSEAVDEYRSNFHEYPWFDLIHTYDIKTLILNRGAHYENDTIYEQALRQAFRAVRDRYPDVQVVYRNTPPGHANCTNGTAVPPLTERQKFGWDGIKWPDFYSWGLFARQNVLARKIVEEFGYIYMDVDSMLALRADGHPHKEDCLHYCLPGPLDIAVQLLYNILPFL